MSLDQPVTHLRLEQWDRDADEHDRTILSYCSEPILDVGCGPGRLTAELATRGRVVLGIDVCDVSVSLTRDRGGPALQRDVFDVLPWEGRWQTILLADGNIGIGGEPVALLRRLRELLLEHGKVVVEIAPAGTPDSDDWATLETRTGAQVIPWSVVGSDTIDRVAGRAGLAVVDRMMAGGRWWAVLGKRNAAR